MMYFVEPKTYLLEFGLNPSAQLLQLLSFIFVENVGNTACTTSHWPGAGQRFWTSGQRQVENSCQSPFVWKPSRGETLSFGFTNWGPGEPNCNNNKEFCLHILPMTNFTWNDGWCTTQLCPVCEYTP